MNTLGIAGQKLDQTRILLNEDQRQFLAVKRKILGSKRVWYKNSNEDFERRFSGL